MIKAAIEKIQDMCAPVIQEVDKIKYSNKPMSEVKKGPSPSPITLSVNTLTGLIDYCNNKLDNSISHIVHIQTSKCISLYGEYEIDYCNRKKYLTAISEFFNFTYGNYYDQEIFIVKLLTQFYDNKQREDILAVVSHVVNEESVSYSDSGVSQNVAVKSGIVNTKQVELVSPIVLCPKDTFSEIEKIESPFILRIKKENNVPTFALYQADSGQFELKAIQETKKYLEDKLDESIIIIA